MIETDVLKCKIMLLLSNCFVKLLITSIRNNTLHLMRSFIFSKNQWRAQKK
jgi:hypothetical protein